MFLDQFEDIDPEIHGIRLPKFKLDEKDYALLNIPKGLDSLGLFRLLVERGLQERLKEIPSEDHGKYQERLKYEMSVIEPTDFVDYFLTTWDWINIARQKGIAVGRARGSAGGSLALYCLRVTNIDPVKYNLYFERFLSPKRTTPNVVDGVKYYSDAADIDLDIEDSRREELIEAIRAKYPGYFCKLCTYHTLQSKACIKDVCKVVLGYSEEQAQEISDLIPTLFGKVYDLRKAEKEVSEFKKWVDNNSRAFKIALKLHDLASSRGSHASAYILSYQPLIDTLPCEMGESEMVSSYDMEITQLFVIKFDLLGLKALGIINEACQNLGLDSDKFDLNYDTVYQHIQEIKYPYGLFQVSGGCNQRVVNKVKPKNIDELAAVVALARPGALQFVDQYAEFTNKGEMQSIHPFFDDVLGATGGLCLFQEQLLKMCEKIGLTKAQGDEVRRIVGKKKVKEMAEWEGKIFDLCEKNGLDKEIPIALWKIMDASKDYSFSACLGETTVVDTERGYKMLFEVKVGEKLKAYNVDEDKNHFVEVLKVMNNEKELYEVELEDGRKIEASLDHKFLTTKGMQKLSKIIENNYAILTD